ncbi:MAG: YheU family protein [Rhodospirillaceae bacterium]
MDQWWEDEYERQTPVAVPHGELSPEALRGVVESFVLREGTDYGARDVPFETKVSQVIRQLERGEARIMFDPVAQSVQIVPVTRQ